MTRDNITRKQNTYNQEEKLPNQMCCPSSPFTSFIPNNLIDFLFYPFFICLFVDCLRGCSHPLTCAAFKSLTIFLSVTLDISGDEHLDTARAYYGVGCVLGALGSTEEALENLNRAREIQTRFLASEQDIEKTEQEINRLHGRTRAEVPFQMLYNRCT